MTAPSDHPHTWPDGVTPDEDRLGRIISRLDLTRETARREYDAALARLDRREAMRDDPNSYEGRGHDPGEPWRDEDTQRGDAG